MQSELLRQTFMRLDTDHDLTISLDELLASVQSDEVAQVMMRSMDVDGNGRIDYQEFCKGFERAMQLTGAMDETPESKEEIAKVRTLLQAAASPYLPPPSVRCLTPSLPCAGRPDQGEEIRRHLRPAAPSV
jgi:hypothetical protein